MKLAPAALLLACLSSAAEARPSPYPPADQFVGDRYDARAPVARQIAVPVGMTREVRRAIHGRPRAWCGWWLGQHLGMTARHLWLARNWAAVGARAGGPQVGAIVVWPHHVGIITGHSARGWIVKSGNDGRQVRERPRSVAGAVAFRRI